MGCLEPLNYLINEKGAVTEAATYPLTINGLAEAQAELWKDIRLSASMRSLLP